MFLMRNWFLFSLFLVFACAHAPERSIASLDEIKFGFIDPAQSIVRLFPNTSGHPDLHHFYLELRDSNKLLVDVALSDIVLKIEKKNPSIYIKRISLGRYELEVSDHISHFKKLKFVVQNRSVKHAIVKRQKPAKSHSKVTVISNAENKLKLHISLKDEKNVAVILDMSPDIILDGLGHLSMPQKVKDGVWEIVIDYPEMNQILYISVRANGVMLEKLLRYQHIEK